MPSYPVHPTTGLRAIGYTRRGPVWPVIGASEPPNDPPTPPLSSPPAPRRDDPASPDGGDRGFPENTPIAEMTDTQKVAYYKHQNRQADHKLAAFKGVTPQDVATLQSELETLRAAQLTADEKALKEATDKAATDARTAVEAELRPKYQAAQLKAIAATVITDHDQLNAFLDLVDPAKFAGDDGEITEDKVLDQLKTFLGATSSPRRSNWGQHSDSNGPPGHRPGDGGRSEAQKRFGTPT